MPSLELEIPTVGALVHHWPSFVDPGVTVQTQAILTHVISHPQLLLTQISVRCDIQRLEHPPQHQRIIYPIDTVHPPIADVSIYSIILLGVYRITNRVPSIDEVKHQWLGPNPCLFLKFCGGSQPITPLCGDISPFCSYANLG